MAKPNAKFYAIEFLQPNYDNTEQRKVKGHVVTNTGYQRIEDQVEITNNGRKEIQDGICTGLYLEDGTLLPPNFTCEYRLKNGMIEVTPPFTVK